MTTPKTSTQRVQKLRDKRAADGIKEVRGAWAAPIDHQAVKTFAATMTAKRKAKGK